MCHKKCIDFNLILNIPRDAYRLKEIDRGPYEDNRSVSWLVGLVFEHVVCIVFRERHASLLVGLLSNSTSGSLGVVGGVRGQGHVGVVLLGLSSELPLALGDGFFRVLVETPERQNDDLVEEKGAEHKHNEAGDGLPMESFAEERTGADPDKQGA